MRKTAITFRGRRVTMFDLGEYDDADRHADWVMEYRRHMLGLKRAEALRLDQLRAESMFTAPGPHLGVSREKPKATAPEIECPHHDKWINAATMRYVCKACGATSDPIAARERDGVFRWQKATDPTEKAPVPTCVHLPVYRHWSDHYQCAICGIALSQPGVTGKGPPREKAPKPEPECVHEYVTHNTAADCYVCATCGATADAADARALRVDPRRIKWCKPNNPANGTK